ncbi:hypothetical protein KIK06_10020 [Nocardiopsis sp. EMB25]|uniref:hypothetical protein n=1 Tax=Nocardiopsis TaxID=2013 RepID=UPI000376B48A|nr:MULTISPECIES: hypothetical protein [Nocardiopsis]MCY9784229.1 hypothetical protein [Nocardiopsis sp. EMB25]
MSAVRQRASEWVALVAIVLGVGLALFAAVGTLAADNLVVPVEVPAAAVPPPSGDGFEFTGAVTAELTVTAPTVVERVWAMAPSLIVAAQIVFVATLLLRVVRSLRTGEPFSAVNARRIGVCAAVTLVGGVLAAALRAVGSHMIVGGAVPSLVGGFALEPVVELPVASLLLGLGLASAAAFLRAGALLREEVEGLV